MRYFLVLIIIALLLSSCGKKNEEVAQYAKQISTDSKNLDEFFAKWPKDEKFTDEVQMNAYLDKVKKELIPVIEGSVKYLEAFKIEDKDLQLVHAKGIKARKFLLESYQDFIKDINKDNYNEKRDMLSKQLTLAKSKQDDYNQSFRAYCEKIKVEVKDVEEKGDKTSKAESKN